MPFILATSSFKASLNFAWSRFGSSFGSIARRALYRRALYSCSDSSDTDGSYFFSMSSMTTSICLRLSRMPSSCSFTSSARYSNALASARCLRSGSCRFHHERRTNTPPNTIAMAPTHHRIPSGRALKATMTITTDSNHRRLRDDELARAKDAAGAPYLRGSGSICSMMCAM
jgi:hypothetical protein